MTTTEQCSQNIIALIDAYNAGRAADDKPAITDNAVGRAVGIDDRAFFAKVREARGDYSVRRYDDVVAAFSTYWLPQAKWPRTIPRPPPAPRTEAAAG